MKKLLLGAAVAAAAFILPAAPAAAYSPYANPLILAVGSLFPRSLTSHFSDSYNVLDYGADPTGANDSTAAFQKAMDLAQGTLWPSGGSVTIPCGTYTINGQLSETIGGNQMFRIKGDGMCSLVQFAGDGPHLTVNAVSGSPGGVDVNDLVLRHNSATTQGNVGLTITGAGGTIAVDLENVRADGVASAGSWNTGFKLTNVNLAAEHVEAHLPDENSAAYTGQTYGMDIEGTVTSGGGQIYSLDNKITHSVFEGGQAGLHIGGPWQGLYLSDSIALGNNYGVMGDNAAVPGQQNMLVTNSHLNAHLAGVYANGVSQVAVSNVLFLHLQGPADPYATVAVTNAQEVGVTNTTFNGSGQGDEEGIKLVGVHEFSVTGNNAITLDGPYFDADPTSTNGTVFGNMAANFSGYTGARMVGCGGSVACGANNFDGKSDYSFDGTNVSLTMPGALFLNGQVFTSNLAGYGFRNGAGGLVNGLSLNANGSMAVAPGASAVTVGGTNIPVTVPSSLTATTLVFDPSGAAPASSSSACTVGQAAWGSGYFYVCVAPNTWQRAALSGF